METEKELVETPTTDAFLESAAKYAAIFEDWYGSSLRDKIRVATDLYNAADNAEYTGVTEESGSHLFIPVVYEHGLAQIQEIADAFDSPILPVDPDSADPVDVIGAAVAKELFSLHLEEAPQGEGWFPFVWTAAHQATIESLAATKWYWSFITDKDGAVVEDRLRFEAVPCGSLMWDPRGSLTREPKWYIHRIFREESYVYQRIADKVWEGEGPYGGTVSFETLKAMATVEESQDRKAQYYPERDPYSEVQGKEKLLELWEIYEKRGDFWYKGLTVKAAHTLEKPHINNDGRDYQPFVLGWTLPRAGHLDGESTALRAKDLQLEINVNRNLDIDGRNRELKSRTLYSTRAGLDLEAFRNGSPLVGAVRVDDNAIREFKYSPTVQAMIPRDSISMRDIANITGRTAPTQGVAQGSVRGSVGVQTLTQNARGPLNRRLKTFWATVIQPGLVKANYLIRRYETDETRLGIAAKRAGLPAQVAPLQVMQLLEKAWYRIRRDPDMRRIDPEGLEQDLGQVAQMAVQAQRPDVAFKVLSEIMRLKGHPEIAQMLLAPVNQGMLPPEQGAGRAAPSQPTGMPGVTAG